MSHRVILLHGILRSSRHMRSLARALEKEGYEVANIDYPSTSHSLEELAEIVQSEIEALAPTDGVTHYVGYSMGGLLARILAHQYPPERMGRMVLLAPPNQGSEVADFFQNWPLYHWLFGPAGGQLTTDQTSIAHLFGPIPCEIGILAGSNSVDPLCNLMLSGVHDGKVSVERTRLEGMKDHRVLHVSHMFFPNAAIVHHEVISFLAKGKFTKESLKA